MKLFVPLALLTASVAEAQYEALFDLANTLGLLKPLDCALPCIVKSANELDCGKDGPADCICNNINTISEKTGPCTKACDAAVSRGEFTTIPNNVVDL